VPASRGPEANLDASGRALASLPETADELRAVARVFNAPASQIKLKNEASERVLKSSRLSDYRVLHFATHGLVAGETALYNEKAEPALALTLPEKAPHLHDGLLTASEVAALNLNADWVILSACNTAAGERAGAEPSSCW
jgi:CHAT domain-containing protein